MLYEHKVGIEIDELESLLLDICECQTLAQIYNEIDGRLRAKKEILILLDKMRKQGGQHVIFNYEGRK